MYIPLNMQVTYVPTAPVVPVALNSAKQLELVTCHVQPFASGFFSLTIAAHSSFELAVPIFSSVPPLPSPSLNWHIESVGVYMDN